MAKYTFEAGAHWPNSLITLTNFKNADSTVEELLIQIKHLQDIGDYDGAQLIIDRNSSILKQYVFDTADVNRMVEEIRNLEIYTHAHKQQIYYQTTSPSEYIYKDDVWIGPTNAI